MILVDTSVWVGHLRDGDPQLAELLEEGEVCMHPFVMGELACGNLRNRSELLQLLGSLPALPAATDREVLELIERRRLMGRGIGYVDVHLIAAVLLAGSTRMWTRDLRLAQICAELKLVWPSG